MEEKNGNKTRLVAVGLFLFILIGVGLGIYLTQGDRSEGEKNEVLSVEKAKSFHSEGLSYQTYQDYFATYGITKPVKTFVYNVELPDGERRAVDPYYDDMYIGFEQNRNETVALYEVEDGIVYLNYDTKTDEVYSMTEWKSKDKKDMDLYLNIYMLQGEKSQLSEKAVKESNPTEKETLVKSIAEKNDELVKLFEKATQSYH